MKQSHNHHHHYAMRANKAKTKQNNAELVVVFSSEDILRIITQLNGICPRHTVQVGD